MGHGHTAGAWYQKAAEQDSEEAQYELGEMYKDGIGVDQSASNALRWYNQVAKSYSPSLRFKASGRIRNIIKSARQQRKENQPGLGKAEDK